MTKKELNQIYYLNKEIKMYTKRLNELRNKSVVGGQKITGMPIGSGISDNVTDIAVNVLELERLIKLKKEQCELEHIKITRYINGVDDSLMRLILSYRYINNFTWNKIATYIGGGNTADSIRMLHHRFLKKSRKN